MTIWRVHLTTREHIKLGLQPGIQAGPHQQKHMHFL